MSKFYCLLLLSPAVCLAAPQVLGFGDASPDEIAQIRAGTYGETFDENPQYSFNYKVADNEEQTYMAMNEDRDGDQVTGSYQYVDPLGSLIIVTYTAGVMGYSETREVKPNYVEIRAKPVKVTTSSTSNSGFSSGSFGSNSGSFSGNSGSSFSGNSGSSFSGSGFGSSNSGTFSDSGFTSSNAGSSTFGSSNSGFNADSIVSQVVSNISPLISSTVSNAVSGSSRGPAVLATPPPLASAPFNSGFSTTSNFGSSNNQFNSNDIVSQVVSNIAPLISSTVSNAVGSSTTSNRFSSRPVPVSRAPVSIPAPAPRRPAPAANTGGSILDLFGSGDSFNVRFNTPEFNIEY